MRQRCAALVIALALTGVVIAGGSATAAQPAPASTTVWLCRPGTTPNPCESDLATTIVRPNGRTTVVDAKPAKHEAVDCFYVYPTVSGQPGPNADLTIDPEEIAVAETQASRFSQVCRVFAPMYPQLTVSTIRSPTPTPVAARVKAYLGVLAAWRDYLDHYNNGRKVVLIGHSQGALMLTALVRREIDPDPLARKQLLSALLIGGQVTVAKGRDVGGSFQHVPACRRRTQTGCVVAYSSFDQPPPPDARFGRSGAGVAVLTGQDPATLEVLCVNPAAPAGGPGALDSFFRTTPVPGPLGMGRPSRYTADTPWVEQPRLYTGTCTPAAGASGLQSDDIGRPTDTRPRVLDVLGPTWGLHLVDVQLTLGNLVDLVRHQIAAAQR
jgi:hypothetical protein